MDTSSVRAEALREHITATEKELQILKDQLASIEAQPNMEHDTQKSKWPLTPEEYLRYGRQMIVPSIGIEGKCHSLHSKSRD